MAIPNTESVLIDSADMKIVEGLNSAKVAPALANPKLGRSYYRELVNTKSTVDGRQLQASQLEQVFKNTKKEWLDYGLMIPMNDGHIKTAGEGLKGFIYGLEFKKEGPVYSLWGKVFLFEPYATAFDEGRFPNISVEIEPKGMDEKGGEYGMYLAGAALQGQTKPALPGLKVFSKKMMTGFRNAMDGALIAFSKLYSAELNLSEGEMKLDVDKLIKAKESFMMGIAALDEAIKEYEGESKEPAKEGDVPPMDADAKKNADLSAKPDPEKEKLSKENAELKAQLSAKKGKEAIELEFTKLINEGKARPSDLERFTKLANLDSIEFAKSNFATKLPAPDQSGEHKSVTNPSLTEAQAKEIHYMKLMKFDQAYIDNAMKGAN
jgi:hypothetical protein